MMVLSVHGSRHKWSHSPASTQAQQYCREQEEPTLVGGLRGFIFETRLGWILPPKKECRAQVHQGLSSNPTENKGNQRKEKISWGNCSLLPSDLRRTGLVSLNQMSINDNLKRQKLFTTKGWCRNHNNNQERYFTSIIPLLLKGWVFWHLFPYIQHGLKMLPEFVLQFFYTTPQLPFTSTGSPPKRKAAAPTI